MQELLKTWATWLADGTFGVNAFIASMAADGLISAGHVAPPAIAQIITQDDDVRMAYGDKGETWAALVLLDEDDGKWEGEVGTTHRDGDIDATCLYVPRDPDAALTYRNSSYVRRAVLRSTKHWLANASDAERTENFLYVVHAAGPEGTSPGGIRRRPRSENIRDIPHAGGLTVTFRVRDRLP
jgi:hypothetical protein